MAVAAPDERLEAEIRRIGRELDAARPRGRGPMRRAEEETLEWTSRHRELQAALLRLVDVAPACRDSHDLADHFRALLAGVEHGPLVLRGGARLPDELGAHLQIDSESYDAHRAELDLALGTLAEEEFRDGPSAGVVVQAYLRESGDVLDEVLDRAAGMGRSTPLAIRLVKGAYWD